MLLLSLLACMKMDDFFFNPERVGAYSLASDVIPAANLEEVAFPSGDLTLYGVWARQDAPGGAPVLIYFHGNARNIDEYMPQLGVYWSLGYETFMFDYRGFGKSEGEAEITGILADGAAAVAYVEESTGLSHEQIPYLGLSLGGSVAVHTAGALPPSVLITEDMFASGQKLINDGSGLDLPDGWMLEEEWDNAAAAAEVTSPYLIIHGAEDDFIQPSHAEIVYASANDPKRLWLVPGADHADAPFVAPEEYGENVTCWIAQTCLE